MPVISQEMMDAPANRYILAPGQWTLGAALHALKQQHGHEWWFLVVELAQASGQPTYFACRFSDLRERFKAERYTLLNIALRDLGAPLTAVEAAVVGSDLVFVQEQAADNAAGIVVIFSSDAQPIVLGIISTGSMRGGVSGGEPSLFELAGMVVAGPAAPIPAAARPAPPPPYEAERKEESAAPGADAKPVKPHENLDRGIQVEIGDSIETGGQVVVAGRDVIYNAPVAEQTRNQMRRFEAAFPREVQIGVEEELVVAVLLPDAPSPFDLRQAQAVSATDEVAIETPIDPRTGALRSVSIEVCVTAAGLKVKGDNKKILTIYPDGRTETRWFMLEPEGSGPQEILIELSHNGRLLDEIHLETTAFAPQVKPRSVLNLSLNIASFALQFSFSAGAAG